MRRMIWAAAVVLASAAPSYAQQTVSPQPNSIVQSPSSAGASTGTSGSIGSPTSTYPAPLRDYNSPSVGYGRLPNTGAGTRSSTYRR